MRRPQTGASTRTMQFKRQKRTTPLQPRQAALFEDRSPTPIKNQIRLPEADLLAIVDALADVILEVAVRRGGGSDEFKSHS